MRRKREIVCFETGERFASVTDAASAIGAARPLVSSALKRHGACRGFHFYYADEAEPDDSVFDRKVYKNSRPIICLETNERFESQARAAKAVGVPREAIYAALRGHIATKGLHFYYADEPKPDEEFFRNRSWTRVRCKETGVVYESIAQAARETGVSESNIQAAAKRHGTAKGLHFYYADEPEPDDLLPSKRGIRVRCVETGVVYESIAQAARETGVSESNIQAAAKRHGTAKGLHFYYADEPEPDDLLPSKRGIRVRCVETGVVYKTITQAAKETGASQAGIRGAASGMAGGYRWEYVDD